jgi:RNA polymerase sigma factor for flagellar operon FliA
MTVPDRTPVEGPGDLWAAFKSSADPQARQALILRYTPLVRFIAGRVQAGTRRTLDSSNLSANGVLGLVHAIDEFEPERGFKFETYAVHCIKNSILDGERDA